MGIKELKAASLVILALGLSACGNDQMQQGKVTEGPVRGAVIFADRVSSGVVSVLDGNEISTVTDASGNFDLSVPTNYGAYVLVSQGGTDIITGKPAMQMVAPPGAGNVTPLTTLLALAPASQQAALKAKIEATGVKYDADISVSATPAALLLSKSVESAIQTLTDGIDPTGTKLTTAQLYDVQKKALTAIAATAATEPSLLNTAALTDAIGTGVTNAIPTIVGAGYGITVSNAATVATSVSNVVASVATSMGNAAGTFSTTTAVTEAAQFPAATQTAIDTSITTNANSAASVVTVVPTAPTVVLTSSSLTGIAINLPISVVFSRAMDATTINSSTFKVAGVTGAVSYNSATHTATFTPSAALNYDTVYAITLTSAIKDTNGLALVPANLSITTVVRPLTGSTGSNGTGANF